MKTHPILLSLLLLVAACANRNTPPPEEDMLYRVECFYQTKPDSAMLILDTLNLALLSAKERAHYCLLRAKVNQQVLADEAETDSLLQAAENHFANGRDKYFEAMTYWIKSWQTGQNRPNTSLMLEYRLKALECIEHCRHIDERLVRFSLTPTNEQNEIDRLKYAIRQRLGMSYLANAYWSEAIRHLKPSEQYYDENQRHKLRTMSAYMLGYAYLGLEMFDSCLMYYEKGRQSAEAIGDTDECAYYHNARAEYFAYRYNAQRFGDEEEKTFLLRQAIAESRNCLAFYGDSIQSAYQWNAIETMANMYYGLQQYDSCILFGRMVADANKAVGRHKLYKHLYHSYKALGDAEQAAQCAEVLINMDYNDSNEKKAVAEVKEEYEKRLEIKQLEIEQQLKRYRLYLGISLLLLMLVVGAWLAFRYRKNKTIEVLRLHEAQRQLQAEFESAHSHSMDMLQQRVMALYRREGKGSFGRILAEFEAAYPQAMEKLKATHPALSETERNVAVLSFLGFRAKEAADLLGLTENTATKYRSNIRKKAGNDPVLSLIR